MARHRMCYRSCKNGTSVNMLSFDLLVEFGADSCKMERIEPFPCNSKQELLQREGYHVRNTDCVNRCLAGRTSVEYARMHRETNTEHVKEATCKKEWYAKIKEKALEKVKTRYEDIKDYFEQRGREYRTSNKEKTRYVNARVQMDGKRTAK